MDIDKDLQTFADVFSALRQDEIENPVTKTVDAETLFEQLNLCLDDEPMADQEFKKVLTQLVLNTPKTSGKRFFNQLFGGRNSRAVLGELLAVVLNTSLYTYKVGGPQVCVEKEIIRQICAKIGYGEHSAGTFPPGGSMANFMAIVMARDHFDQDIRCAGMQRTLIAYTSTESHYSIAKNASFAGIGRENIRYISTNDNGQMLVDVLQQQIEKDIKANLNPFFINATAGTTVLGVFDPLEEIASIARKYDLWMHVDAALGGAVMFSEQYRHLLKGAEHSDSFSFNAHKMLGVPLSASMIVARDKKHLYQSFSQDAEYLYQADDDDLNPGKMSIQCGRRNDALKFWTLWKSVGTKGLGDIVNHLFDLSKIAHDYVENNPDYTVFSQHPSLAVCFNYKNIDPKLLCKTLYDQQQVMVSYGTHNGVTFIRMITVNSNNTTLDILDFFNVIETFVKQNNKIITLQNSS